MAHTPGPWWLKDNPYGYAPIIVAEERPIAKVLFYGDRGDPEVHDNALLMRASPDLLKALHRMVLVFGSEDWRMQEQREHGQQGVSQAQARAIAAGLTAIAKAEGGEGA